MPGTSDTIWMQSLSLAFIPFILFGGCVAQANDTEVTLGAGGLIPQKSTHVSMASEDLQISTHLISITYHFLNKDDHDTKAIVAFPLPVLSGGDIGNEPITLFDENDPNFVGFTIKTDGQETPVGTKMNATRGGHDITVFLRKRGLSPSVLSKQFNAELGRLPAKTFHQLLAQRFIVPEDTGTQATIVYWANWDMHVQYYWTQQFPAHRPVELVQSYHPVVGGSYLTSGADNASTLAPYCGDAATLKRINDALAQAPSDSPMLYENKIQYILKTARNWNGPIKNFKLSIETDGPDDILLTCFPGLKQMSPTRYESSLSNYVPDKDLDILILRKSAPR